jgi:SAM-dependent methyltransferase
MTNPMESEFSYTAAEYEHIRCNLCGSERHEILCTKDRNKLPVRTCLCLDCGLIFINPRMTEKWYGEYYRKEYREQGVRFRGIPAKNHDKETLFSRAVPHGVALARRFDGIWSNGLTVEVGSSVGGVLSGLQQTLSVDVIGIEPSKDEADFANAKCIKTYCSLIEQFHEKLPPVANVVCVQSLNHFLNPRLFLTWAHQLLQPEGRLVLEVANFRHMLRQWGWMPRAVQIDHTYMFVPEVLEAFVTAAGFRMLRMDVDEDKSPDELQNNKRDGLPRLHASLIAAREPVAPFSRDIRAPAADIQKSLAALPNSPFVYFARHGFKASRRKLRRKLANQLSNLQRKKPI